MKRKIALLLIFVLLLSLCLTGCGKYREKDLIGKTAEEIQSQYGKFDIQGPFITTDSKYRGYGYGYLLQESRVSFLGTSHAEYYFIEFEDGIAVGCYKGWLLNGG